MPPDPADANVTPAPPAPSGFAAFTSGTGKAVAIDSSAVASAARLFDGTAPRLDATATPADAPKPADATVAPPEEAPAPPALSDFPAFTSGSGKDVAIDPSAVASAAHLFDNSLPPPDSDRTVATPAPKPSDTTVAPPTSSAGLASLTSRGDTVVSFLRRIVCLKEIRSKPRTLELIRSGQTDGTRLMVLLVASITQKEDQDESLSLELTDGWTSMTVQCDEPLSHFVNAKKIRVGTRLAIANAALHEASSQSPKLHLFANSTRRARHAKLGLQRSRMLSVPLRSAIPGGGQLSSTTAVVLRTYPCLFFEPASVPGSKGTMRTEDEELAAANKHAQHVNELLRKAAPALLEEARDKALSAAGAFASAYFAASDGSEYVSTLGDDERGLLERQIKKVRESQDAVYAKAVAALKQKEQRTSKRLLRVRIASIDGREQPFTAMLTWWSPNDGVMQAMREGAAIRLRNLNVAKTRVRGLALSNARNTVLEPMEISDTVRRAVEFNPRECATIAEAENAVTSGPSKEFDLVAVVVRSSNASAQPFVELADAQDGPLVRLQRPNLRTAAQGNDLEDARFGRVFAAKPGSVFGLQNAQLCRSGGPLTLRVTDELVVLPAKGLNQQHLAERVRQLQAWAESQIFAASEATCAGSRTLIGRVVELTLKQGECFLRMTTIAKEEEVRVRVPAELHEALLRSALHSMSNGAFAHEQIPCGETLEFLAQISQRMASAMLRCAVKTTNGAAVLADVAPADASMVMSAGIL